MTMNKDLKTEKVYYGTVEVSRVYELCFESINDSQALKDLKTIIPDEHFEDQDWEQQQISIIELKRKLIPKVVVMKDSK